MKEAIAHCCIVLVPFLVAAGWIASDEAFMQPMSQILNYLKVRASYGLTGNYNIDNYNYLARVAKANYVLGGALAPGKALESLRNNELTWEEKNSWIWVLILVS